MRRYFSKKHYLARKLRKNLTKEERELWKRIRNRKVYGVFRRQHVIEPYIVDFYHHKARLVIELDGGQHNDEQNRRYDKRRTRFLESRGLDVVRFWNFEIRDNIGEVVNYIYDLVWGR